MTKEVKDLLRDRKIVIGMILVPLLIFPLMGQAINISSESARAAAATTSFGLMDLDGGNQSSLAVRYFSSLPNVTVVPISPQPVSQGMQAALKDNVTSLVVIPQGFSANITARRQVSLESYTSIASLGITAAAKAGQVSSIVSSFGTYLTAYYIQTSASGLNPSVVIRPLAVKDSTFLRGELITASPTAVTGIGITQSITLPIATLIVVIFAMQIASTAMAVEKEQKTFETLLTLPVSRFQILGSKLVGSVVIAGLGAITSMAGFTYYMQSITSVTSAGATSSVSITPAPTFYVMLGILVFLTLALATTIAIIISVFSADVRGAQAVVGYVGIVVWIPTLMAVFGDFNSFSLALKAVVLAIPFSYVGVFSTVGYFGDLTVGLIGVGYLTLWIVVALYAASRLFNSERILTARFTFRRKKSPPQS